MCGLVRLPGGRPGRECEFAAAPGRRRRRLSTWAAGRSSWDRRECIHRRGAGMLQGLGARVLGQGSVGRGGAARRTADLLGPLGPARQRMDAARSSSPAMSTTRSPGSGGAAAVYGPQKGADPTTGGESSTPLSPTGQTSSQTRPARTSATPRGGAAGGVGFAASGGARRRNRPRHRPHLRTRRLPRALTALSECDLVITGEGALDNQTLRGKAQPAWPRQPVARGIPVVAVCRAVTVSARRTKEVGVQAAYASTTGADTPNRCISAPGAVARAHRGTHRGRPPRATVGSSNRQGDRMSAWTRIRARRAVRTTGATASATSGSVMAGSSRSRRMTADLAGMPRIGRHGGQSGRGRGTAARARRLPRPRQRPRPHRVEGFTTATARRPLAASPRSSTCRSTASRRRRRTALEVKRRRRPRPGVRRRRLLGRRHPRQRPGTAPARTRPGVFGFKCFLLHSGVDEFPPARPGRSSRRRCATEHVRRPDDRARRGLAPDRPRSHPRRRELRLDSCTPGPGQRRTKR